MKLGYDYHGRRELLDSFKPHWAAASAIAAILAAAASTYAQEKQKVKADQARRKAANDAISGSGGSVQATWAPTAPKFDAGSGGGGASMQGMGDLFKQPAGHATEQQQGFSLGVKSLDAPAESKSFADASNGFQIADQNQALPVDKISDDSVNHQPATGGGDTLGTAAGIGGSLASLYQAYQASKNQVQPGQRPQLGGMNLQPTANRWLNR